MASKGALGRGLYFGNYKVRHVAAHTICTAVNQSVYCVQSGLFFRKCWIFFEGVGSSIAEKIVEIVESGRLRKLELIGKDEKIQCMELFQK